MTFSGIPFRARVLVVTCLCGCIVSLFNVSAFAAPTKNTINDPRYFLYTINTFDRSVEAYQTQPGSGTVRHSGHRPTSQFPTTVISHPTDRFLYVASKVIDVIETFEVDAGTGQLTLLKDKTVSVGRAPHLFTLDPLGRFLYVALRAGGVAVYAMHPQDGTLTQVPGSPFAAGNRPRSVAAHPNGHFIYVSNAHSNTISAYRVNRDSGVLTPLSGSPFFAGDDTPNVPPDPMRDKPVEAGAMPFFITMDASGQFLYVANWMGASLSAFRVDGESGAISPLEGSPFTTCFDPFSAEAHPTEGYLYVTCREPHIVTGYRINLASGQLEPLPGSPVKTHGEFPTAIQFEPEGKLAFVTNYHTNTIAVYNFDVNTGALHFNELIQTRLGPREMALIKKPESTPRQVVPYYLAMTSQNVLALYSNERPNEGTRPNADNKIATAIVGKTPSAMASHPTHPIVYITNQADNTVSAFHIETETKQLTPLPGSPYAVGKSPVAIAVDTNGWYLYVVNQGSDNLSVFALNHLSGVPTEIPLSPLPVGKQPSSIAIDNAARFAYVTNKGSDTLSVFRYWTAISPIIDNRIRYDILPKTGKKPVSVAVDHAGIFLYVANADSKNVSIFEIHDRSGHLRETVSSPIPLEGSPVAVATHPERAFTYIASKNPGSVSVYRRQDLMGAVEKIQVKALTGFEPVQLHLDSAGRDLFVVTKTGLLRCPLDPAIGKLNSCIAERTNIIPAAVSTLQ